jgi:hypothetical protein
VRINEEDPSFFDVGIGSTANPPPPPATSTSLHCHTERKLREKKGRKPRSITVSGGGEMGGWVWSQFQRQ